MVSSTVDQTLSRSAHLFWQAVLVQVHQPLEEARIGQQLLGHYPGVFLLQQDADRIHHSQDQVWWVSVDPTKRISDKCSTSSFQK